jgi:hypothetical protein
MGLAGKPTWRAIFGYPIEQCAALWPVQMICRPVYISTYCASRKSA